MASIVVQDELIDDSNNDNLVAGLVGTFSFKDRFEYRLSRLLGRVVTVAEGKGSESIDIYIGPKSGVATSTVMYDRRIRTFAEDLQSAMRKTARYAHGREKDEALCDQWDVILVYTSQHVHHTIISLQQTFESHKSKFNAVIAQMCGLDEVDEYGSSLDTDLGDRIIRLHELTNSYGGAMKQQNELIELAWTLIRDCPASDVRLRCILGSALSVKVYDLICDLSHPCRTHHTLARAATTSPVFRKVYIHIASPSPSPALAISPPPRPTPVVQAPRNHHFHTSTSSLCSLTACQGTLMDTIRQYLPEEDCGRNLLRLRPISKQATALLIGCVLRDMPLPPGSDTYYLFGFVTCRSETEERDLADHYRQLLKTTINPTAVFNGIVKALEHSTLFMLMQKKGLQNMEKSLPALHKFLTTHPEKRWSVFRLIQFLRDVDNEEPPPCIKRDYGFNLCTQREQVTKLKALYAEVIDKVGPSELHYACTYGRLLNHAIKTLGLVDPSMRRLLQNDYHNPGTGYDNSEGLWLYARPLFKRSLKS